MRHGDAREGKWRGNCRMQWVASTLHTTSKHGVSSITTADAHTSAASSRLNWRPPLIYVYSSVSPKDESWFLRLCHHISNSVYPQSTRSPRALRNKISADSDLQNVGVRRKPKLTKHRGCDNVLPGQDHHTWEGGGRMMDEYGAIVEWSLVGGNRINTERNLLELSCIQQVTGLWGESSSLC